MKLFDVGEYVEKGWPVATSKQLQSAFLTLGKDKQDLELYEDFHFDTRLSTQMLAAMDLLGESPMGEALVEELRIHNGAVAREEGRLCLVRPQTRDGKALVRAGISAGVGGKVWYSFGEGVDIIAEGVLGAEGGEDGFPMYLLAMDVGSFFVVERTGLFIDGPTKLGFSWDGKLLKQYLRPAKGGK